jgi:hypothetical protein
MRISIDIRSYIKFGLIEIIFRLRQSTYCTVMAVALLEEQNDFTAISQHSISAD